MASPSNLKQNGNQNNSTNDERVVWEDGNWAIIEGMDAWDGLARSKTRDSIGEAVAAPWDPGMTVAPGPKSSHKYIKVKLADLLANPASSTGTGTVPQGQTVPHYGKFPVPADFKTPEGTPVAPPSPFTPKPWMNKAIPEFPHTCRVCGGRYYQGLDKVVHEATEQTPLRGSCPGSPRDQRKAEKRKYP